MPWIIDYHTVVEQMRGQRFKSVYYNSGAFAFADGTETRTVGWLTQPDPTVREAARPSIVQVEPPTVAALVALVRSAWHDHLPGRAWVMPASHWAFELEYGSADWLPDVLEHVKLDPGLLVGRNNASAIEFSQAESDEFSFVVTRLLESLTTSDFTLAFPGRQVLCMLHHHKQAWWTTPLPDLAATLRTLPAPASPPSE